MHAYKGIVIFIILMQIIGVHGIILNIVALLLNVEMRW